MTAPILQVKDMHVTYRRRGKVVQAVDGVDLALRTGTTHGLVGESGCGKTTLVKAVLGLLRPASGQVLLDGRDLVGLRGAAQRALRPRMQVVFQDPTTSLDPRMSVHEIVAEPLRIHRRYRPERVAELLEQVGLPGDPGAGRPGEFSGGQRQRIGIARALALDPAVLVLDEPVSALDKSVQAQVLNLLARLQRELGLSYLFISHDLAVVRHVSHDVSVMREGRIVETGTREAVLAAPAHAYTRELLAAVPATRPPSLSPVDSR